MGLANLSPNPNPKTNPNLHLISNPNPNPIPNPNPNPIPNPDQFEFLFSFPGSLKPQVFSQTESAEGALFNPNFSLREWFNRYW